MNSYGNILGIERWLVFGGSWGVTLGLAYAQRHPERVTEMVLLGITMTRRAEIDWLYRGVGRLFPEQHACFRAGVPAAERDGDLVAAYYRLLQNPDPTIHRQAAYDWCVWEASLISTDPDYVPDPRWSDPDFQLAFARIVTHYFHHNAWLENGILLRNADRLTGIPGVFGTRPFRPRRAPYHCLGTQSSLVRQRTNRCQRSGTFPQ